MVPRAPVAAFHSPAATLRHCCMCSAKRASAQPAIDALTAECAEHEAKIDTLNKRQAVLKHETNELKAANNDARDKLSSAQFEILGCEERITKLNSQIVNSPARLRTELKTLATQLEDDRAGVDDVERKRRATQARLEGVKQAERVRLVAAAGAGIRVLSRPHGVRFAGH